MPTPKSTFLQSYIDTARAILSVTKGNTDCAEALINEMKSKEARAARHGIAIESLRTLLDIELQAWEQFYVRMMLEHGPTKVWKNAWTARGRRA